MVALEHYRAHGLHVVRARAFNHTGPGQTPRFAVPSFAKQVAQIEVARQDPILEVGNLSALRDFLDVRDVVEAYVALMELGKPGEAYNVCSGRGVAMQTILEELVARSKVGITVTVDPALIRPVDVPELVGDNAKIQRDTGWKPEIPLDQTLTDVLAYWRKQMPFVGDAGQSFA
jgi:GDP-4-dehydro-6-deoxy-D-mannose reductase